jgi:hypothetical protein
MRLIKEHLSSFSYLIVLDNVDSFSDEDQQQTFHLMTQLCSIIPRVIVADRHEPNRAFRWR